MPDAVFITIYVIVFITSGIIMATQWRRKSRASKIVKYIALIVCCFILVHAISAVFLAWLLALYVRTR